MSSAMFAPLRVCALCTLLACGSDPHVDDEATDTGVDGGAEGDARVDASRRVDAGLDASVPEADASTTDTGIPDTGIPDTGTPDTGAPVSAGARGTPPATWKEHWFEHDQPLQLVASNDWVALYFDDDVDRAQTSWMLPFLTRVWQYTVQHYGQFTDGSRDGRLYAIYHQGRYSGGHPSTYFDGSHDFRNVSDVGPGPYPDGSFAVSTHEVSHVVEGAARQMHGSPAFGLWGDSKWAEFYQYDLYVGLGLTQEAQRVYSEFSKKSDDFPRAGTFWFRDWFYPLWKDHGGVQVMDNYFRLLAQHFRKNGKDYGGGMNWGEYVHFMSGAAGTDLRGQAEQAFGWPSERQAQLAKARTDFPGVTY